MTSMFISFLLLVLTSSAAAFWRMECRGSVGMARLDPMMNPGTASQHAHIIHGSSGFSSNPTYEDLSRGECTSCAVTQDKSAYWTPNLYFRHANGSFQAVNQVGGMLAYYFLNKDQKNPDGAIRAFPNDFRMIAGDSTRRSYSVGGLSYLEADPDKSFWGRLGQINQKDLEQRALGFNCLNYQRAPEGSLARHYLPDKAYLDANCPDGVRFEVSFPSCWNGKDLDSPDHRSHVAYPDLVLNGNCPEGFDVKIPGLFYETIWDTNAFNGMPGEFVISNGDVLGFGYHGDFISGWDAEFLQQAVDTCTNLSGRVQDCPLFSLQSEERQRSCKMRIPSFVASEKVAGLIGDALPGNVPIKYGPDPVNGEPQTSSVSVPVPTVGYTPGTTVTGSDYLPGGVFRESSTTTTATTTSTATKADALNDEGPTTTAAPSSPNAAGYEVVATQYVTDGNIVSKLVVVEAVQYVVSATETVTVTAPTSSLKARRGIHMRRQRHRSRQ
ncbi:uncharacterized protein B0T15DRAFT_118402 [Chaetomium strumarium]|uniref:DUF1996 domain-containing protein n=1 Tax=Chaetomium strumarium TaxID=1170767 RepID=A0AAJ0GZ06_9PEZI|nr:hypothetical protein B0T15DRAFT_118402 [Chaetomium strumarium]